MRDLHETRAETAPTSGLGPFGRPEPADLFAALWDSELPDLDRFLAGHEGLDPSDLAAVLRIDQAHRWERGERPAAEAYLARFPRVAADHTAAVDLIHFEFLLRERLGPPPTLDEFVGRFPVYAETLRAQVELHLALATDPGTSPGGGPSGDTE